MDILSKSLNEQSRTKTLQRNMQICLRVEAGESPSVIAREYGITRARVYQIAARRARQAAERAKVVR